MATTTKSKAKKKTTKKPVKQASAKLSTKPSKSTKVTKATTSKKTLASKVTKKPVINSVNIKLRNLNLLSGILGIVLAIAAGFLMNNSTYQLFSGLLTKDAILSKTETVFVPAVHSVIDFELRWAVVGILAISAIIPIMAATRQRKMYEESLTKKIMLPRWIEMAVVGALMVEIIALLSGVQDLATLKLIGGFIFVTGLLGYLWEKQIAESNTSVKGLFRLSILTGILPWIVIACFAVNTYLYGMIRYPWYVYALYVAGIVTVWSYFRNQMRFNKEQYNYEFTEKSYIRTGIFAKLSFALILIIGLFK